MTNELPAYDNLPAKQSRWEVSVHNAARDVLGGFQRPSDKPPGMVVNGRYISASSSWSNLAHPINLTFRRVRHRLVPFRQEFGQ